MALLFLGFSRSDKHQDFHCLRKTPFAFFGSLCIPVISPMKPERIGEVVVSTTFVAIAGDN